MTAKEYLQQALRLDERINSKISQLESLRELATKCTSTITGMPHNPSPSQSPMADAVCKIIDLQDEINRDIDHLVDLKRELVGVIRNVEDVECRLLLELRYLCFMSWEDIAVQMGYTTRNIHYLHKQALRLVIVPQ
ncbi:MAG: DUF1492 domain-containing protein [Pseudoruminococcus massiliensis]|uniref:DUF1492 domain-containing protein n=1 Tax=Pseudoruminococcus massiliensis TaxID=2086583 RepID=UPI0039917E92|nr:DUF1492 domain-containing protein [Oscillospiraceae bacterium]